MDIATFHASRRFAEVRSGRIAYFEQGHGPVALFLHGIVSRYGGVSDVETCLADLAGILDAVEATVENKVARAATMLANGADELRGHVGKARSSLGRARQPGPPAALEPELDRAGAIDAADELPLPLSAGLPP